MTNDNDLIRRVDALECFMGYDRQGDIKDAIAAIPAVTPAVAVTLADAFDKADWFWRAMDPDDCGDSPAEAVNRGMIGLFCVSEVASSYTGPTRYGFLAPVLDPESDDEEFVHFATQQEAIEAAKVRKAAAQADYEARTLAAAKAVQK